MSKEMINTFLVFGGMMGMVGWVVLWWWIGSASEKEWINIASIFLAIAPVYFFFAYMIAH